jgi:cytochrome P450
VRYTSPVIFMRRTLTCNYTMNGHGYRPGDKVLLFYWSANRDEEVFDQPSRFDITRSPNPHLGFGGPGPHFCLGAHLARREIRMMLRELLDRVPDIRGSHQRRLGRGKRVVGELARAGPPTDLPVRPLGEHPLGGAGRHKESARNVVPGAVCSGSLRVVE